MTSRGKIQRIKCADVSTIGRNTQGVRIMGLDDGDSLAVIALVPRDELGDDIDNELVENNSDIPVSSDVEPADDVRTESDANNSNDTEANDTEANEQGESEE
jgi:DNA gyrase subunit A